MSKTIQEKAQLIVTSAAMVCGTRNIGELFEIFNYISTHIDEYTQPTPTKQEEKE